MHHVVPKSVGGTNDLSNLVKLPASVHYKVHYLLPFVFIELGDLKSSAKMKYALARMTRANKKAYSLNKKKKYYKNIRKLVYVKGENSSAYGRKVSEETKEKIRKSLTGVKQPMWLREKLSKLRKGKKHSEETKKKMRHAHKINEDRKWLFRRKKSEKTRRKMSEVQTGKVWIVNKQLKKRTRCRPECIPDGWEKGWNW